MTWTFLVALPVVLPILGAGLSLAFASVRRLQGILSAGILGSVLVVAIAFVVINLITDLLYMVINPKVAAEAKKGANNV